MNYNNICIIKTMRAIIMFIVIYFAMKYFTIGKIPYSEIFMIAFVAVLTQILLDIYRPMIIINNSNNKLKNYKIKKFFN